MGFSINFVKIGKKTGQGKIVIDQFSECFESPLHFWNVANYKKQWSEGLMRIVNGENKSALITAMYQPDVANFIMWWIMFRDRDLVIFQNHLLIMEQLEHPFDIINLYSFIPDRLSSTDHWDNDRDQVSEWFIEFEKIKQFVGNELQV